MSGPGEKRGDSFVMQPEQGGISFTAFILGLATSTFIHLGERPDPESGSVRVDLTLARQSLDLLGLLREKTRGNLTAEEDKLFGSVLADLQLRFVNAQKSR